MSKRVHFEVQVWEAEDHWWEPVLDETFAEPFPRREFKTVEAAIKAGGKMFGPSVKWRVVEVVLEETQVFVCVARRRRKAKA